MTGIPVDQATVSIMDKQNQTNHHGICTIEQYKVDGNNESYTRDDVLVVAKAHDQCLVTDIYSYASSPNLYVWHVFNDRGLYKPNEAVHVKGYVRLLEVKGDAKVPVYAQGTINYTVHDPRGEQLQQSTVQLNSYGAFDVQFTLPDNVNLGRLQC